MSDEIGVILQMLYTPEFGSAARDFSSLSSPVPTLSVPGCRMDMTYAPVQIPSRERRESVGEREVGRLFRFNMSPEASTYLVRGVVENKDALKHLKEAVKKDPNCVEAFSDARIAGFPAFPSGAVGTNQDVESLIHKNILQANNLDGSGVFVAVVDTGINMAYLRDRGVTANFDGDKSWVPPGVTGTPGEWPLPPLNDARLRGLRHGTMVAYDVSIGAPKCTLLDFALLRSTTEGETAMDGFLSDAILAFSRLLRFLSESNPKPALVVNNSWGMYHPSWDFPVGDPGNYSDNPDHPFNIIVESLDDAGADILFASGNCGDECSDGRCQGQTNRPIYGANSHQKVLCVAGVTIENERVCYSSKGPGRLHEEKPDLCCYTHFKGSEVFGNNSPDSGTSTACPVAAGVVAVIRTVRSAEETSPAVLRQVLRRNSDDLGNQGFDFAHGSGVINVSKTLDSLGIGQGEGEIINLAEGQTVSGRLESTDDKVIYRFKLGEKLNIELDGPTGADFDLYVRKGQIPTKNDYDERGYTPSADETIKLKMETPGEYYIMVHSFGGSGEYTLKADVV